MNAKVAQIEELLGFGWDVADIDSDDEGITVWLTHGGRSQQLHLDRADAWELLFGELPQVEAGRSVMLATR